MKKYFKLIPLLGLVLGLAAGCGQSSGQPADSSETAKSASAGSLSKGEWIGMLGDGFGYTESAEEGDKYSDVTSADSYYGAVQGCAEWGVLTEEGTFGPDEEVSWQYAIETVVRAIGIDRIESAGVAVSEDDLVGFFDTNLAETGSISLDDSITEEDAEQLIDIATDYMYDLSPVERFEYTYNEGVYEVGADDITFRGDGSTATVNNAQNYQEGDVIYIQPSQTSAAKAIRVMSVNGSELTYTSAAAEDVYEELTVSGTYEATIISVEGADEANTEARVSNGSASIVNCSDGSRQRHAVSGVYKKTDSAAVQAGFSVDGNGVTFQQDLGGGGSFQVTISNITVKTDIDYGILKGLKKADATVSFDDKIELSYESEHYAKSISLGKVQLAIGTTPCTVELSLALNIGLDGEASITYTSNVVGSISYRQGSSMTKSVKNNDSTFDFHAQVTATAEPTAKVDLKLLGFSIANLKVTTGIVAIATVDVDLMGNNPACTDIYFYVPLRWAVNEDSCVMTSISSKLQYSQTVWDSESSPINRRFHFEDGEETPNDECTRGAEEEVETAAVDEDGAVYDEYKIFEFEEINFGIIRPASYQIFLDEGSTLTIGFETLPDGYSQSDLTYSVEDSSVCTVSGGIVTAVASGSTTVKISTSDEQFSTYITVTVNGGYNDTSGFQDL